jgi:hypothetical protein
MLLAEGFNGASRTNIKTALLLISKMTGFAARNAETTMDTPATELLRETRKLDQRQLE